MSFPLIDTKDIKISNGYELLCETSLNDIEGEELELCKFGLEKSEKVKILIISKELKSDLFHITLEGGSKEFKKTFFIVKLTLDLLDIMRD